MATRRSARTVPAVTEAVGYVRVSTQDQVDSGLSLESQRSRIEAQAAANGWRLVGIYEDAGLSAKNMARPGLRAALDALGPGRVLVAVKMDRLTRSIRDLYTLTETVEDRGAEWATVEERYDTTTAVGRAMRDLLARFNQLERELAGERTSSALTAKKARGEVLGALPLGYIAVRDDQGHLQAVPVADELETVRLARALHAEGLSLRQIAKRLADSGRSTKRGGRWEAMTVKKLLVPRYVEQIAARGTGSCS